MIYSNGINFGKNSHSVGLHPNVVEKIYKESPNIRPEATTYAGEINGNP